MKQRRPEKEKKWWKSLNLFVCVCQQIVCEDVNKLVNCIWSALCVEHKHKPPSFGVWESIIAEAHFRFAVMLVFLGFHNFPGAFFSARQRSRRLILGFMTIVFLALLLGFCLLVGKCCQNDRTFCWSLSSMKWGNGWNPHACVRFVWQDLTRPVISTEFSMASPLPQNCLKYQHRNGLDFELLLNTNVRVHNIPFNYLNTFKSQVGLNLPSNSANTLQFHLYALKWYLPQLKVQNGSEQNMYAIFISINWNRNALDF